MVRSSNGKKTNARTAHSSPQQIDVYYDGDCFFCKRFALMAKLRKKYTMTLYNLRDHDDKRKKLTDMGFDLDAGMVVVIDGQYYHGHQAVAVLLAHSRNSRLFAWVASRRVFRHLYPYINSVRKFVLRLSGKKVSFD